jgi:hypothetical protein
MTRETHNHRPQSSATGQPILRRRDGSIHLEAYTHRAKQLRTAAFLGMFRWIRIAIPRLVRRSGERKVMPRMAEV